MRETVLPKFIHKYTHTTHTHFFNLMTLCTISSKEYPGPKRVQLLQILTSIYNEGRAFINRRFWLIVNNVVDTLVL